MTPKVTLIYDTTLTSAGQTSALQSCPFRQSCLFPPCEDKEIQRHIVYESPEICEEIVKPSSSEMADSHIYDRKREVTLR